MSRKNFIYRRSVRVIIAVSIVLQFFGCKKSDSSDNGPLHLQNNAFDAKGDPDAIHCCEGGPEKCGISACSRDPTTSRSTIAHSLFLDQCESEGGKLLGCECGFSGCSKKVKTAEPVYSEIAGYDLYGRPHTILTCVDQCPASYTSSRSESAEADHVTEFESRCTAQEFKFIETHWGIKVPRSDFICTGRI
jgi:hypothetical protein